MGTEVKHNSTRKNFEIFSNGKHAGSLNYVWAEDDRFILSKTTISKDYEGLGFERKLVLTAIDFARVNGMKITVNCPIAQEVFDQNVDFQKILSH